MKKNNKNDCCIPGKISSIVGKQKGDNHVPHQHACLMILMGCPSAVLYFGACILGSTEVNKDFLK